MSTAGNLPPLGLDYLTVSAAHPVEQIEAAAESGFAMVGLRMAAPTGLALAHEIVGDPGMQRDIARALANTGVRLLDVEAFTLAADTDVRALARPVAVAAELGASIFQLVVEDPHLPRAQDRFAQLCAIAAPYGITVAVEYMRWRSLKSLAQAAAFVEGTQQSNGALCLDCLHASRCGDRPEDFAKLPVGAVAYVQLCDAVAAQPSTTEELLAEARGGRQHPGEGALWLNELLDALPPTVPLSIEVPRAIDSGKSVRKRAQQAHAAARQFFAQRALRHH